LILKAALQSTDTKKSTFIAQQKAPIEGLQTRLTFSGKNKNP